MRCAVAPGVGSPRVGKREILAKKPTSSAPQRGVTRTFRLEISSAVLKGGSSAAFSPRSQPSAGPGQEGDGAETDAARGGAPWVERILRTVLRRPQPHDILCGCYPQDAVAAERSAESAKRRFPDAAGHRSRSSSAKWILLGPSAISRTNQYNVS